ncbi:hypothetical protein [Microcella alkaliphila]|uniref:Major tail protein n=1 Tax=Microcella alkaliphila TaxID=279828 RepID=A0A0U4WXM0_9MICO|nr:hypothetical protein [Microcella alkaliphila]BAU32456.1 uncharacterized protein MalAC0309_1605 [Microcella alkaliphila]
MAVNSKNVFVGAPDQATTGAILTGPETDTIPQTIDDFSFTGLNDSGYVNEDGVTITPSDSTSSIKDWAGAEIRRILTEFTGEISWTHLELSAEAARNYFGEEQVQVTAATELHGTQMRGSLGKNYLPNKAWYFKVKDGDRRVVVFVPHGQVVSRGDIPLVQSGPITLPVTLATYPDAHGQNIYLYTDDGIFSAPAPEGP